MANTTEEITIALQAAATQIAEKLGLKFSENRTHVWEDQTALIVSPQGINVGIVSVYRGEGRTYREDIYSVNGENIYSNRYGITEQGWENMPTTTILLDSNEVLYMGY